MKRVTMFLIASCPYCKQALRMMDELFTENPEYASIEIEKIDETIYPDVADRYNYYYVPTFYVGSEKLHEGVATVKKLRRVFDAALEHNNQ
jgi:glutaredoxin